MVWSAAIDTPFPEHARNFMDAPPRLPPPLYHPNVVADAVRGSQMVFARWTSVALELQKLPRAVAGLAIATMGVLLARMATGPGKRQRRR